MNAQKARGADLENGKLVERVKALIPILIPLLILRSDEPTNLQRLWNAVVTTGERGKPE